MSKVLHILDKPRSKQYIKFVVDPTDEDGWFIHVQWIDKKTEKIKSQSTIIRKDVERWKGSLIGMGGWIESNETNKNI